MNKVDKISWTLLILFEIVMVLLFPTLINIFILVFVFIFIIYIFALDYNYAKKTKKWQS